MTTTSATGASTGTGTGTRAVLDACVLFSAPVRDTLLRATDTGLYKVYWTEEILEEVRRNLVETGRTTEEKAQRLTNVMKESFPEAMVRGHMRLVGAMTNSPKDRHVLASAIACKAQVIVTDNLRDFPQKALAPFNIEAQSPNTFLSNLFYQTPERMAQIMVEQTADLRNPSKTVGEVLDTLAKQAPAFAHLVRDKLGLE